MPILPTEPDCYPDDLLASSSALDSEWWLLHTKPRQEKQVMRYLLNKQIPFYGPLVPQRQRSPSGRVRTSYLPLFSGYLFLCGDNTARHEAVCCNRLVKTALIRDTQMLIEDLRQIQSLIQEDVPLTVESKIEAGQMVRVKNGTFAGYEGVVVRRENETRLLVSVRFMEQGVSVKLEDFQVEVT